VNIAGLFLTFKQVIRSVTLVFLPLAFTALIVWATAGSSRGTTSDPIYASLWIWLAAHQLPLDLASAKLTFLPIGALVLVFFAIRSGFKRALASEIAPEKLVIIFPSFYALIATGISLFASLREEALTVAWYLTLPITFFIALLFCWIVAKIAPDRQRLPWEVAAHWAARAFAIALIIAALVFVGSFGYHYKSVINLTTVIGPGIFGGAALIALQILYLPNFIVATLGYLVGSGALIGQSTLIHPLVHQLDQLPAIPLLGALPRGTFPYAIAGVAIALVLGFWVHRKLYDQYLDDRPAFMALGFLALYAVIVAQFSTGQLLTDKLNPVGVSWWLFPLALTGEFALGMALSRSLIWFKSYRMSKAHRVDEPDNKKGGAS
jgi:hypothetical protein